MEIVNKVQQSALQQLDLEEILEETPIVTIDLKEILYKGLALREADLKEFVKSYTWEDVAGKLVAIYCSEDAIIPTWVYMRLLAKAKQYTPFVYSGSYVNYSNGRWRLVIDRFITTTSLEDAKVVVKGCSNEQIPEEMYAYFVDKLMNITSSIMFGEPCSTVPVYKKPKQRK